MFRKTLIRLFVVTMMITTSLIVFSAIRNYQVASNNKECRETVNEAESTGLKGGFMILESIGRTISNNASQ